MVTREELLQRVWGYDYFGDTRLLDVHVRRLRRKIELEPDIPQLLTTVRGVGYRFATTTHVSRFKHREWPTAGPVVPALAGGDRVRVGVGGGGQPRGGRTWRLATTYMLEQRRQSATLQATVNARLVDASLRSGSGQPGRVAQRPCRRSWFVDPARPAGWPACPAAGRSTPPTYRRRCWHPTPGEAVWLATDIDGIPVLAVSLQGVSAGTVFIELFPLVELERIQRFLVLVLVAGAVVSGLLGVGLGWWTSKRALRPLTELTSSAARFAAGDLQVRLPDQGDPDLDPLASTFNATVEALERRVRLDARFAGDISHELRSPLTTMVNAIEVLRHRQSAMPPAANQAVGSARR